MALVLLALLVNLVWLEVNASTVPQVNQVLKEASAKIVWLANLV